jgi:uncharacterized protein with NAD-binding domain and iron-sulfur cluster
VKRNVQRDSEQDDGRRLIILGGGIASLTAAFYASQPGHEIAFPGGIHVYEASGRLGGKGSSVRGIPTGDPNGNRIEEHGLHVWFGFYDNAFALMQACHEYLEHQAKHGYTRWSSSLRSVDDGFRPCSRIAVMDHDGASWRPWVATFPEDAGETPWAPREPNSPMVQPSTLALRAVRLAESFVRSLGAPAVPGYEPRAEAGLFHFPSLLPGTTRFADAVDCYFVAPDGSLGGQELLSWTLRFVARAAREVRNRLDGTVRQHDGVRRTWVVVDLLLAAARGLIDDGVILSESFDDIDRYDLREWLLSHGASEESVSSGLLKALVYDLAFAYEKGDPRRPRCSAATGVYGLLRVLLTYRGAVMWKMNAGMGEIVFAPIYEALKRRGVRFHFGHEVKSIALDEDGTRATRIEFLAQASGPNDGALDTIWVESGPLSGTLPYWKDSASTDAPTPRGIDVDIGDVIVYGLPVGTIRGVVPNAPQPWRTCSDAVQTVNTIALQLWLRAPVGRLAPWASPDLTVGGYTEPFDTWSDMAVLAGERLDGSTEPGTVAYFTNVAPDEFEDIEGTACRFVLDGLSAIWPGFETTLLRGSYARLNSSPSERYTLSLPGTKAARLRPNDTSLQNVRPVGDWTHNSLSAGCIEAAVISGMLAARVIRPDVVLPIFGEPPST